MVDQIHISAADNGPAQDLNALSNQAFQPKTSSTESCSVLAKSTGSQSFINNNGSQASGTFLTSALAPKANLDNQSFFSPNIAMTPDLIFPFDMAPTHQLNTESFMGKTLNSMEASDPLIRGLSFPFDLTPFPQHNISISGDHIQSSHANDSFVRYPDVLPPTVPGRYKVVGFAGENTGADDFGGHQNFFPFDITPS